MGAAAAVGKERTRVIGVLTAPRVAAFIGTAAGRRAPGAVGAALAGGTSIVCPATVAASSLWLWVPLWLGGPRPVCHSVAATRFSCYQLKLWAGCCGCGGGVFPVVIYGCEGWTVKKAECRRIDAFELWCWRRLLRVPWTARRSNQSILKEISPGCSLEGMMLKLKLQYFGHLM